MSVIPLKTFGITFALLTAPFFAHATEKTAASEGARSKTVAIKSDPGLKPFVESYIAAVNARDARAIMAMTHPKDLKALIRFLAHPPADFKGSTLRSMLLSDDPVPKKHSAFFLKRYLPGSPPPQEGLTVWSIRPTHTVVFFYHKSPTFFYHRSQAHERQVTICLVHEHDRWFLVFGVPDPDFAKNFGGTR